jgi:hypothetical protein
MSELSQRTKKPLSTSVLDRLPEEQKEQLNHWLDEENRSYDEVRELMESTFGVTTSRSALSRYYEREILPDRLAEDAEALADWHETEQPDYDTACFVRAKQIAFHALAAREPDVQTAERMFRIVAATERVLLNRDRIELEQRRMILRERRAMHWGARMKPTPGAEDPRSYRMFLEMVKDGTFDAPVAGAEEGEEESGEPRAGR